MREYNFLCLGRLEYRTNLAVGREDEGCDVTLETLGGLGLESWVLGLEEAVECRYDTSVYLTRCKFFSS